MSKPWCISVGFILGIIFVYVIKWLMKGGGR
jgi:hypothetical protein